MSDSTFPRLHSAALMGFAVLAISALSVPAQAALLYNGGFEINTGSGQLGFNTTADGWTTNGFNFVFASGTADTTGAFGVDGTLLLWGPGTLSNNGLTASSPDGGFFMVLDGDYLPTGTNGRQTAPVTQTLTNLIVGADYTVGFYWAAAQQAGFDGATTQSLTVGFGSNPTQSTPSFDLPSHGFSGWMHQTLTFTADDTTQLLSFLAVGNVPVPPFLLLDGITVDGPEVPEPASALLILGGLTVMGSVARYRSRKSSKV